MAIENMPTDNGMNFEPGDGGWVKYEKKEVGNWDELRETLQDICFLNPDDPYIKMHLSELPADNESLLVMAESMLGNQELLTRLPDEREERGIVKNETEDGFGDQWEMRSVNKASTVRKLGELVEKLKTEKQG